MFIMTNNNFDCDNCEKIHSDHGTSNRMETEFLVELEEEHQNTNKYCASKKYQQEHSILNCPIRPDQINEAKSFLTHQTMLDKLNENYDVVMKKRSIVVDILTILFGIGTWIGINGIFIELPLLVEEAPESWSLPSYLGVMVQIGNLFALIYTLAQKYTQRTIKVSYLIYIILAIGTVSHLLIAFFYSHVTNVFGNEHSLALLILTIFSALNSCSSSVLYMPYMGRFKEIYLVTYFIGEGLSGLLPSVIGLIQGINGRTECILKNVTETGTEIYEEYTPPPLFNSKMYFICIFILMICSYIGFTLLDRLKMTRKHYAAVTISHGNNYEYQSERNIDSSGTTNLDEFTHKISLREYKMLLLLVGTISFFSNGVFNSIQSYSTLPYSSQSYHLSLAIGAIANPAACFLAVFFSYTSIPNIVTLSSIALILTIYVLITAAMSPFPPFHGTLLGEILVISIWTILIGIISYTKLSINTVMRSQGGKSLVWAGGFTQIGSLLGATFIFILINFTNIFKEADPDTC